MHLAMALAAILAASPLPPPRPAEPPPAAPRTWPHEKEASLPLVLVHSWYDPYCCNDRDCRPVADGSVRPTTGGWFVQETGETVPYSQARESQDGRFHVCIWPPGAKIPKVRCLYVPPGGV